MRKLALVTLLLVGACSDGGGEQAAPKDDAVTLQPGQWEMTSEVLKIESVDDAAPAMKAAAGSKTTFAACVTAAAAKQPEASLFGGNNGTCTYDNFYMSRGRVNAMMTCKQPGLNGNLNMAIDGTYTATTIDVGSDVGSALAGSGDFKMSAKLTGRRVGECPAEPTKQAAG